MAEAITNLIIDQQTDSEVHRTIQILDKNKSGFIVDTKEIFKILDNIGDTKIAVVSINGKYRTGKSFLLNYFLRYLTNHETCGEEWINETYDNGFEWKGGSKPHTMGIHVWSQPFMIKCKDGSDIALLLVDSQGNFDDHSTLQDIGVIFSFSLLLSSTLIMNIIQLLRDDDLQFVEYFSMFAENFNTEKKSIIKLFQNLVFLIRDWQSDCEYPYGYYDDSTPLDNNYKKDNIDPSRDQVLEAQNTRQEISRYFNHVSSFLMPHPGKGVFSRDFHGQQEKIDSDFIENVSKFVPLMVKNIEPKKICGKSLTGNTLKAFLNEWARIITEHRFPEVKTLAAATAHVSYTLALKHSLTMYENVMRACLASKPSTEAFLKRHNSEKDEILQYFTTEPKGRISDDSKNEMINDLLDRINKMFEGFRELNNVRIDKDLMVEKFSATMDEQQKISKKLEDQEKECNFARVDQALAREKLNALKEAHEKEMREKVAEFNQQKRLTEENAELQKRLTQLNADQIKRIEELEKLVIPWYVKKIHVNYGEFNHEGCLSRNINEGYGGWHVYLRPEYTREENIAATGFHFEYSKSSQSEKDDLAYGAGGLYRYIFTETHGDRKVRSVWLSNKLEGDCGTMDINHQRVKDGNNLYLCWNYANLGGSVLKEERTITEKEMITIDQLLKQAEIEKQNSQRLEETYKKELGKQSSEREELYSTDERALEIWKW